MSRETYKLLVVLQNPYDKGKLTKWHPSTWRTEFQKSRAGRRLFNEALPEECTTRKSSVYVEWKFHFTNASPKVGKGARATFQPDLSHLRRAIKRVQPDIILACGKHAEEALVELWDGALIAIPHPSYMCLTNVLLEHCKKLLIHWRILKVYPDWRKKYLNDEWIAPVAEDTPRLALRQRRGYTEREAL